LFQYNRSRLLVLIKTDCEDSRVLECYAVLTCLRGLIDRKDKGRTSHGNGGTSLPLDTAQHLGELQWSAAPLLEIHMSDEGHCVFCEVETQFQVRSQTCEKRL
jgi:hypothetical protein